MGLVWSGYMERMWNGTGQRVRPLVFRGRFRASWACVVSHDFKTHEFSFVSVELHPRLFSPCLTCVYHHLEFQSISRNRTQIVNAYLPDPPIVGKSSRCGMRELHFDFVNQISHKNPKKSRT